MQVYHTSMGLVPADGGATGACLPPDLLRAIFQKACTASALPTAASGMTVIQDSHPRPPSGSAAWFQKGGAVHSTLGL